MAPASQIAHNPTTAKDVIVEPRARLRRWPLLWTMSFAIGASLLLWGVVFLGIGWAAKLLAG